MSLLPRPSRPIMKGIARSALLFAFSVSLMPPVRAQVPVAATATSDWSFNVSPYIWIAGVEVDTTLDRSPPTTPPSASRFESKITGGALLSAQVNYKAVGLWVDFVWIQLETNSVQAGPAFSAVDLESDILHSTVALSYRLPTTGNFHAELLAGARFWSVSEDLAATGGQLPGFGVSGDNTWADPVIGASLRYDLSSKWSLLTKGTISVAADQSEGWEVMGGVVYRFSEAWSGTLGYRFLHEEFLENRFKFITDISGFILGVSYRF
jgi:opacity protein-like surface antigen